MGEILVFPWERGRGERISPTTGPADVAVAEELHAVGDRCKNVPILASFQLF